MDKWLDVNDRLPEPIELTKYGLVLVACKIHLDEGVEITHWMPLPEPPREQYR